MIAEKKYPLSEIKKRLEQSALPFSGETELGSAYFSFRQPSFYAGTAIHAGSRVRPELMQAMEVNLEDRYREEDPETDRFIQDFPIQIIARDSRFEYDINRERHRAIYVTVKESWRLRVWKRDLTRREMETSLAKYDEFHRLMSIVAEHLFKQNKFAVVFDCHSYNYQRNARLPWYQDKKPDINLGTAAVNRSVFAPVIDDFLKRLSTIIVDGHPISVAENDIFKGGYLSRKLCSDHYDRMLVYAIEFKKLFMDEWSGEFCNARFNELVKKFAVAAKENMNHPILKGRQK